MENPCPLCNAKSEILFENEKQKFFICQNCRGIFLDKNYFPDEITEKLHYQNHNNDVNDIRYQNFVSPITNSILVDFKSENFGLDFGSGTNSVIVKILEEKNYNLKQFDPYFHNNIELLNQKFDYIACCEVIEHFQNPKKEFSLFKKLLNQKGKLYCMTELYEEKQDFKNWYYKNDTTHIFFYHEKTIKWIFENFGFDNYQINNRLITFSN